MAQTDDYDIGSFAAECIAGSHALAFPGRQIEIDVAHALEAFRSETHLAIDGQPPATLWALLSKNYRDRHGRWLRIHANFASHARAAAVALAAEPTPEAFARAVGRADALDLEERIHAAGGAAATLRTPEEWAAHPQRAALRSQPLAIVERIATSPPCVLRGRPLRVLDLTRVIAGPVAGRVLALYGHDVLAITAPQLEQIDELVIDTGFGKRSAFLDFDTPGDVAAFSELVATADVLVESYRPGALERRGFGARACAAINPHLIYVSISAFGDGGPWGARRGFDSLVQMLTGLAAGADATADPRPLPAQALDHGTGWLAAATTLAVIERRTREGGSYYVTLSLARTALALATRRRAATNDSALPPPPTATMPSAFGNLRYVLPPGRIDGARLAYASPPHRLGADARRWRDPISRDT